MATNKNKMPIIGDAVIAAHTKSKNEDKNFILDEAKAFWNENPQLAFYATSFETTTTGQGTKFLVATMIYGLVKRQMEADAMDEHLKGGD